MEAWMYINISLMYFPPSLALHQCMDQWRQTLQLAVQGNTSVSFSFNYTWI